jgi:RimJ/RimL family protein N-acetyltransferase
VSLRLRDGGVGYWIAPGARRRGYATEAVRSASAWAGREQGRTRFFLTTHPDNTASQRVAQKAGFRYVGKRRAERPFRDGTAEELFFVLALEDE